MDLPESMLRIPEVEEAQVAMAAHSEMVPNVAVSAPSKYRRLDAARVIHHDGCLWYTGADHLRALADAAATVGGDVYWYAPNASGDVGDHESCPGPIAIDLEPLATYIERCESNDRQPKSEAFAAFPTEIVNSFFHFWAEESSIFSPGGGWICTAWDNADISALASGWSFLDAYRESRPSAVDDVATWTNCLGDLLTPMIWRQRSRPRAPGWMNRVTGRKQHVGYSFEGSTLDRYLSRMYGEEQAREIWDVSREMESYAPPLVSDAWEQLERLRADRPEISDQLAALWNSSRPDT